MHPAQHEQLREASRPLATASSGLDPLVVKPKGACRMLNCGITRLYELLNADELVSFKDGSSRKITTESIRAYIARRIAESAPQLEGG